MDIFLTKTHGFATGGPLFMPRSLVRHVFIMDACILFDVFWTVKQKHPPTAMITLEIARTIFYITLIGFV